MTISNKCVFVSAVPPHPVITTIPHASNTQPPLFKLGKQYQFACTATGNPLPTVSWYWLQCERGDLACKPSRNNETRFIEVPETSIMRPTTNEAIVLVDGYTESGVFRCVAKSTKYLAKDFVIDMEYKLTGEWT